MSPEHVGKDEKDVRALSKVPEITIFFWIIKVLCTTVGETASDFLNVNLGLGLVGTSIVMGGLLLSALFFQLKSKKYVPAIYWITVVLISIFGTLVTDNLTDNMDVPLEISTIAFSVLLGLVFALWYAREKTLSIHSIFTTRRELFYWLAILFTFALGTATGDLMAESLGLGYATTGIIVVGIVSLFSIAWKMWLNPILAFWIIYVMTRPLGASLGDYLSQPGKYGGLNLGATLTSMIFLLAIVGTVLFLSVTKKDQTPKISSAKQSEVSGSGGILQTTAVMLLLVTVSAWGYYWRKTTLQSTTEKASSHATKGSVSSGSMSNSGSRQEIRPEPSPLGDMSAFRTIALDMLNLVNSGDLSGAKTRAWDLEYEWDNAEARLKPLDQAKWTEIDNAIDEALRQVRAVSPDAQACKASLETLLRVLDSQR